MRLLDLTLPDPADNLALDEALLVAAEEADGEVLRLWELASPAVVVGAGGSVTVDVNATACAADGVPVLRRSSGGGTVVLGTGCLCFSLVLAYDRAPGLNEIPASNRYVLGRVRRALQSVMPGATLEGTSDLAALGLKFSGNAQQRKRRHFLHHGTLLCGFDLALLPKYLHAPERQPDYRRDRPHAEFVANLPASVAEAKRLLVAEWEPVGEYDPLPWETVRQLVAEKYARADWNNRR